ncbi:MAG: hypothetical protein QOJ07_1695 [Thermoleophilaceae bacterium]|nr:hypothetical protein [Thermoleophilaceae bacterium]
MQPQQPPPPPQPPPYGYYPPPHPYFYDPSELYWAGQDDRPGYLHHPERDNPAAITGFSFAISALGLLVLSSGISFVVSLPCAIIGLVVGRRGMVAVDSGATTRHRGYAKAGFVIGIVTTVLASFAGLLLVLGAIFSNAG